ncbi:hypothetical protein M409DRAFT_69449 [Zasmidium cellare ATCC 36951]|uniref:Sulfotransferase domain-containing protein n=1 Tax=Zasmidium cellare ATCC 36951 TaxID=1080233 RepID=A0A6A6C913_ZASCE|nr:uncharacterized protein M409DRAFT_69449 [Zasmidium cellare ATCC 36951]KAF2161926.1 hypothetical protein M409DRAFT_69449 [Zasmidium cellare ATCC 36951]
MATAEDYRRMGVWASVKEPDQNIDRRKCTRQVPMEVLCFGLPRTGTQSMQEALTILGYPTYHFSSIFRNCRDGEMWKDAISAKFKGVGQKYGKEEFDQLLGHVSATTDAPSILFWEELMEYYPSAKIILVERDVEKWVASISVLLEGILNPFSRYVLQYTDPWYYARIAGCGMRWMEALCGSMEFQTAKANARASYRRHYERVRDTVPKERMLEFELGQGWEPLCKFLDKPVPNVPFPHRNEAHTTKAGIDVFIVKALMNSLRNIAVVLGFAAIAMYLVRLWQ